MTNARKPVLPGVCVGIRISDRAGELEQTLSVLTVPGRRPLSLVLFADRPLAAQDVAHSAYRDVPWIVTPSAPGGAANFNRLVAMSDMPVVVLLEIGARPAPGALDRLAGVLERQPAVALAVPSTNDGGAPQRLFPHEPGGAHSVWRVALEADRRFGDQTAAVAPEALEDVCLAARRDVVEAIGPADERDARWPQAYATRVRRAGFLIVWARGAYVWRVPRRAHPLQHARGDACVGRAQTDHGCAPVVPTGGIERPLVSCIMPTRGRVEFALQAVEMFLRQDYPDKELVIVDDGEHGLEARLPAHENVRYMRVAAGTSVGAKRNYACAVARGSIIAQWDDDDWYGPGRLDAQVAPLIGGQADISALRMPLFFDLEGWRFWAIDASLHRRLFRGDVHGGTLVFAREVWERRARYPDASLAEDAAFLERALAQGARLAPLGSDGVFVYVRHGRNTWAFRCGQHMGSESWRPVSEPPFSAEDRAFYAARSRGFIPRRPTVSCVMPTRNRRRWVKQALKYFLRQDYGPRELIVLDDGEDPVGDLMPEDSNVRYVPLAARMTLGTKRNLGAELADGQLIAHWDDDDWYATGRLSYQAAELSRHDASLCGPAQTLFFDPVARSAWRYEAPGHPRPWLAGSALCYRRDAWARTRFPPLDEGEDNQFAWSHPPDTTLVLDNWRYFAAVIHPENTSPKNTSGAYWHTEPLAVVRETLGADYEFYESVELH